MQWAARILGLLYLAGGLLALRQARMNALLDKALARITLEAPSRQDRIVGAWMFAAGGLTALSGALLLLLSRWAAMAFIACWLSQAAYLYWASTTAEYGQKATFNAFVVFTLATGAVLWWSGTGVLG